jgi:glycosyltransferase involved in cell wall biosynthesis
MAHAVPCIATASAGLRGLIEPGSSGLIISPGDPQALEEAIIKLLDRPDDARRIGCNARRRVQRHFDPEAEADRLVELYLHVLRMSEELAHYPSNRPLR